ncbi:MAG: DinB family protein [Chitinophagaceae bacterium]|nr:DinB family protein [Chitinophagaceae bacterium]
MTESKRLVTLFQNLYNGNPWIDVNIISSLQKLTAAQVSKRILPNCNSIWEITNHLICWKENVLQRLQGEIIKTPYHNYVQEIKSNSDEEWKNTLIQLEITQKKWIEFLKNIKDEDLEKTYPINNMTYYEHIQGIIQHDCYHLGQIVLLSKLS